MAAIIVTGTPGTGKTTLARKLAKKLGFSYVDVNALILKKKLHSGYDRKRKCRIVDENKLGSLLAKMIRQGGDMVIDSHMSQCIPAELVDLCIVTRCGLKTLRKRLAKKGYDERKIRENLECEIMEICATEAREAGHRVIEADTRCALSAGMAGARKGNTTFRAGWQGRRKSCR